MDSFTPEEIAILVEKSLRGTLTEKEQDLLNLWLQQKAERQLTGDIKVENEEALKDRLLKRIKSDAGISDRSARQNTQTRTAKILFRSAAAVIFLVLVGGASYLFLTKQNNKPNNTSSFNQEDFPPGNNGAMLTLASGKTIIIDSTTNGRIAAQGNQSIVKKAGKLFYKNERKSKQLNQQANNTISTPRGKTFKVILSDGTKVWLNAASSITYPITFTGNSRNVELRGEAYFEVAHNSQKTFKVKTQGTIIEDLGTAFNVKAYNDEADLKVTLVEGAIKVDKTPLKPGQQAIVKSDKLRIVQANVDQAIAWKNGVFIFKGSNIKDVMKQISRWYDIDVKYKGKIPDLRFGGGITRNCNLSEVLSILKQSNIHFKLENRTVTVME
ncbi:MAG TPA: FecR domain-containing protein [Chitinophagaceae bacterium]|nr:FecR domain-containing protein [Chitinophagaceae bacterium]